MTASQPVDPRLRPTRLSGGISIGLALLGWAVLTVALVPVPATVLLGIGTALVAGGIAILDRDRRVRVGGQMAVATGALAAVTGIGLALGNSLYGVVGAAVVGPALIWSGVSRRSPSAFLEAARGLGVAAVVVAVLAGGVLLLTAGAALVFHVRAAVAAIAETAGYRIAVTMVASGVVLAAARSEDAADGRRAAAWGGTIAVLTGILVAVATAIPDIDAVDVVPWPVSWLFGLAGNSLVVALATALAVATVGATVAGRSRDWRRDLTPTDVVDGTIAGSGALPILVVSIVAAAAGVPGGTQTVGNDVGPPVVVGSGGQVLVAGVIALVTVGSLVAGLAWLLAFSPATDENTALGLGSGVLFIAALVVGVLGGSRIVVAVGVLCAILAWTSARRAIVLGDQLGRRPSTVRVECLSFGAAAATGIVALLIVVGSPRLFALVRDAPRPEALAVVLGFVVIVLYPLLRS